MDSPPGLQLVKAGAGMQPWPGRCSPVAASFPRWCVGLGWSPCRGPMRAPSPLPLRYLLRVAFCLPGPSWALGARVRIGTDMAPTFLGPPV